MLGNYGGIENPAIADIGAALDIRQKRLDAEEAKRKEIRTGQLIAEAVPGLRPDSPLHKLAQEDPQKFVFMAKTMGVPLNSGEQMQSMVDDTHAIANIGRDDPEGAIKYAATLSQQRKQMGLDTTKLDSWVQLAQQDPGKAMRAMDMADKTFNADVYHKRDLEDQKMANEKRALDIQEKRASGMTPFEQAQIKHWNDTSASEGGGLSADAIELAATRLLSGEQRRDVLTNLGRGQQGAADLRAIENRVAEKAKEQGIDASKILQNIQNVRADNRTFLELGAREGKIATAAQEAQNFAKIALDASQKVPRDNFVPWNKLKNYSESQLSDPNLAAFKAANTSLINAYARAVGGGAVTVHGQEEGEKMLNTATSPESYNAVVQQILTETQAALSSPKQVREQMHGGSESPAYTGEVKNSSSIEDLVNKYAK